MTDPSMDLDTRLSAYLDGELSDADTTELEALIAADEAIAERLEALAMARDDFETSASEIDSVPMSASLSALVDDLREGGRTADEPSNVVAFLFWKRAGQFVAEHRAIAASVAVAAGTMAMTTAIPAQVASHDGLGGTYYADSGLGAVLEASASGTTKDIGDGVSATPRLTFASGDEYCRVVDVTSAATEGRLVACRTGTAWQVAIANYSPTRGATPDAPYQTASAAGAKGIESFLDEAMSDAPLGPEEEADLMESGWDRPATDTE